jgi:membrane associated rhomboid family serine protease
MQLTRYFALIFAVLCILIFIVQLAIPSFTDAFVLVSADAFARPWILVTSIFLHGSTEHLLYNMLALALFGTILERIIGSKKFLFVFFLTGVIASIASTFIYNASLGASGAIFGLLGCLAILRPRMTIWAMGVPMPMFVAVIVWLLIDLAGIFYPTNIANAAHIAGLLSGIVIGILWRNKFKIETRKQQKPKIVEEKELENWEDEWMK